MGTQDRTLTDVEDPSQEELLEQISYQQTYGYEALDEAIDVLGGLEVIRYTANKISQLKDTDDSEPF